MFATKTQTFLFQNEEYQYCANHVYDSCNWLVPSNVTNNYCSACQLNRLIPNLNNSDHLEKWQRLEKAKHRLIYSLICLGLPLKNKIEVPTLGLAFDFLSDDNRNNQEPPVRTGHKKGVITINIKEADSVHREFNRQKMGEPYRTLIGHFRHEIGHYYWDLLIKTNADNLAEFRQLFGDETFDYSAALQNYYRQGAPTNWNDSFISEYATAHPWEDWAECWAHYLHLMDTLETAHSFGIRLQPEGHKNPPLKMDAHFNPYSEPNFDIIIEAYTPLTFALNALNRGMGLSDFYPFTFNAQVVKKLRFIHQVIRAN
jgi:hypothetical protein